MNCVLRVYLSFTPTASAWQRPVSRWFSLLFRVSVLLDTNTLNASLDVNKEKKKIISLLSTSLWTFDVWSYAETWMTSTWGPVLCSAGAWPLSLSRQSLGEVPMNRQAPIRHLGIYSCWRWSDDKLKCSDIFICLLVDDKPISINLFCRYVNRKNTNGGTHGRHANLLLATSMPTVACRPWTIAWQVQMEPSRVNLGMKREASILLCSRLKPESTGMLAVAPAIAVPVLTFNRTNATNLLLRPVACYHNSKAMSRTQIKWPGPNSPS